MHVTRIQRGETEILVVPVLADNVVYLVCREGQAVLIDAGEAAPVREALAENNLVLRHIFITHSHGDHIFGLKELNKMVGTDRRAVRGTLGEHARPKEIAAPGHTPDGKMFYFPEAGALFTGDTLINGACGRPSDMQALFQSLEKIKQLPPDTLLFGGHDYLDENLRFGLRVEPDNAAIQARLELYRRDPAAALFVSLEEELKTNALLRAPHLETFTALRLAKNRFG